MNTEEKIFKRLSALIAQGYVLRCKNGNIQVVGEALPRLISSVADSARAEVYDDFLGHAQEYAKLGRKNEAGVIAGVTFEDTIRRICRKNDIEESGQKLDALISELTKRELITGGKAKRARAAAGLRNHEAHCQWDDFEMADVTPVITLTRELLDQLLG